MFVNKMVRTEPFFRKCCFCIPLQSCLQIWACIKVITDIGVTVFLGLVTILLDMRDGLSFKEFTALDAFCLMIMLLLIDGGFMVFLSVGLCMMTDINISGFLGLLVLLDRRDGLSFQEFTTKDAFCLIIMLLLIDGGFMVFLSVGLCMSNVRSLKIFYCYSIYMVVMGAATLLGLSIYGAVQLDNLGDDALMATLIVCGIVNTGLDVIIILTLKSEIIKLHNKQQFEFVTFKAEERTDHNQLEEERLHV